MRSPFTSLLAISSVLLSALSSAASPPPTYENTAITRTVTLGGSISTITTLYNVKALTDSPGDYELALGGKGEDEPVWWEVLIGGKKLEGKEWSVQSGARAAGHNSAESALPPIVSIPTNLNNKDQTVTFTVNQQLIHHSTPLPKEIAQDDPQYLLFESDSIFVESAYPTMKETVKYRAPGKIISHSIPPSKYTRDQDFKKVGASLTLGPYHNIPATFGLDGGENFEQHPIAIHYPTDEPVLAIKSFNRTVDVAWWSNVIKVQDDVSLVNDGPALKGHFSRLHFQMARFRPTFPPQILREITYPLPEGSRDAWYTDAIGNVSTSHFRPSPETKNGQAQGPAILELKPRYPILGGWKFEFSVGWEMPLAKYVKTATVGGSGASAGENKDEGRLVAKIPFMTGLRDVAADQVELTVVLPEGVRYVPILATQ